MSSIQKNISDKVKSLVIKGQHSSNTVRWFKFHETPATAPALQLFFENEHTGWIIDLMICFLERALLRAEKSMGVYRSKYVAHFTVLEKNFKKRDSFEVFHRYLGYYDYLLYQNFMFQITFTQGNIDRVCTLIMQKGHGLSDNLYVFFPFPDYYNAHLEINDVMIDIINHITREWLNTHNRKVHVYPTFKFPSQLKGSNVYSIYFLILMQKYSYNSISHLFQDMDTLLLTRAKALSIYKILGQLMSYCIRTIAAQGDHNAKHAYDVYMGKHATTPLPMNLDNFNLLRKWFAECAFQKESQVNWLNNILPVIPIKGTSLQEALGSRPKLAAHMKNFLPLKNHPVGKFKMYV